MKHNMGQSFKATKTSNVLFFVEHSLNIHLIVLNKKLVHKLK